MIAQEVHDHLKSLEAGWVNWKRSCDSFKAGDPGAEVTGIAVGWKAHFHALREAVAKGCNLFVCHEPLYYDHDDVESENFFQYEAVRAKRDFLAGHGMVVVRCHDVWDQMPDIGIPDSWGHLLGFSDALPESDGLTKVFDVSGRRAGDLARQVLDGVRKLGHECVQFLGDREAPVTRLAIGTGAITPFERFVSRFGADMAVLTDDGYCFWREGALALDLGVPVVVVNHCAAEDHGMALLAKHLAETFPGVRVHHLPQANSLQLVQG